MRTRACYHEGEEAGSFDVEEVRGLTIIGKLLVGVEQADDAEADALAILRAAFAGALTRVVDSFHGCELHGLVGGDVDSRAVPRHSRQQSCYETEGSDDLEVATSELYIALTQEVEGTDSEGEEGTQRPRRGDRVEELDDSRGREGYGPEVVHLVAHRLGVKDHPLRILHPSVSDEDPYSRDRRPDDREPRGG